MLGHLCCCVGQLTVEYITVINTTRWLYSYLPKFTRFFLCLVHLASLYNLVNKANLVHIFSLVCLFFSVHVSGHYVSIIRRNNCIYATLGVYYSVWVTVWYARCIPDSHPHRITSTKCRINTTVSPEDGHIVARNM